MGKAGNDGEALAERAFDAWRAGRLDELREVARAIGPGFLRLDVRPRSGFANLCFHPNGDAAAPESAADGSVRYVPCALDGAAARLGIATRAEFVNVLRQLAADLAGAPTVPPDLRIGPKQAIERGAPEHGLPPTPRNTFYRWVRNPKNRDLLGIDKRLVKWAGQPVLVAGLLQLHASNRRKTKLAPRAPNAGRSTKRKGRT